jgi:hypothetical protein
MKDSNDTIGIRSHDLPVCSAMPQPLRHRVSRVCKIFNLVIYERRRVSDTFVPL